MSDEDDDSPSPLRLFIIGLRLLFDALMLVVVLGLIGFIVFVTGLERDQRDPERTADGITVLTGG
ncbi:MAG: YdcF family protein, partial [Methyloceanibacter sp.]